MLKIVLKEYKTGKMFDMDSDYYDSIYQNLMIGLDGEVYDVSGWAYDGAGGATYENVNDKFEIIIMP